jgi:four helix bundle protein
MSAFENLEVWRRAVKFSGALYKGLCHLKDYSFKDQLTRAGLSVASNIAEGMERDSVADRIRHLTIARSSCGEARTQIFVGLDVGYIDASTGKAWINESREISAMLVGLSRFVRKNRETPVSD